MLDNYYSVEKMGELKSRALRREAAQERLARLAQKKVRNKGRRGFFSLGWLRLQNGLATQSWKQVTEMKVQYLPLRQH